MFEFKAAPRTTIQQIIEEYGYSADDGLDGSTHPSEKSSYADIGRIDFTAIQVAISDRLDTANMIAEQSANHATDGDNYLPLTVDTPYSAHSIQESGGPNTPDKEFSPRGLSPGWHDETHITTGTGTHASTKVVPHTTRGRSRANTLARWRSETMIVEDKDLEESAKLALKVALEALNCLSRMDEPADDAVYRSLAEACGCCGFAQE
jgi:hypothetical protein